MQLTSLDWGIILLFFGLTLAVGLWVARSAGRSTTDFFLSGRNMPWWLLGISMVATTFSADTPNLVTDIVRISVAGNWVWWAFIDRYVDGICLCTPLAKSGVVTDLNSMSCYSGKEAAFKGFRALYLRVFLM